MLNWFKKKFADDAEISSPEENREPQPVASAVTVVKNDVADFLGRFQARLAKTRNLFVNQIDELFSGKKVIDGELLEHLEEILLAADLGAGITQEILEKARVQVKRKELDDPQLLKQVIKDTLLQYLESSAKPADLVMPAAGPFVIMVLGVNGVGKTTTIGKMAHKFKQSGHSVLLVAADTFRAAAIEQLQIWGERTGVEVVAQQSGVDPSSVVYDAFSYAVPRKFDVIIVDTAGRMHTKVHLVEELKKIKRVMAKKIDGAPHEVMLVLDATTGQNAISQTRIFNEAVLLTGLTMTKMDGTAKGGIIVNICHNFNIPVRFIGIGEQIEDLYDFDPDDFVEALFND